ncbi:MAG: hypothetical protein AAGI89_12315 [Pseudomonadota bacterium]
MSGGETSRTAFKVASAPKPKRLPPISFRVNEAERDWLLKKAGSQSLGAYARARVLAGAKIKAKKTASSPKERDVHLAQALALLGQSGVASALGALSEAVVLSTVPMSEAVEHEITMACQDIAEIKTLLMMALRTTEH